MTIFTRQWMPVPKSRHANVVNQFGLTNYNIHTNTRRTLSIGYRHNLQASLQECPQNTSRRRFIQVRHLRHAE